MNIAAILLFCFVPCVRENSKNEHIYKRNLICSKPGCLYECKRFTSIVRKAGEGTGSYHLHCTGFHQLPYTLPAASTTLVWGKLTFNTFSFTGLARTHRFDEFYTILFEVVCLDRLRWKYFYTKSCSIQLALSRPVNSVVSKTKTEARSTQISKTKTLNLENEAP